MFLFVCLLLSSCGDRSDDGYVHYTDADFGEVIQLASTELDFGFLGSPSKIEILDTIILIVDNSRERILSIYGESDHKLIKTVFSSGLGPGEYLSLWWFQLRGDELWTFDLQLGRIMGYRVAEVMSEANPKPFAKVTFPGASPTEALRLNSGGFVITDQMAKGALLSFSDGDGVIDHNMDVKYPPITEMEFERSTEKRIYEIRAMYNSANNKIVAYYLLNNIVEIYDGSDGSLLRRIMSPFDYTVPTNNASNGKLNIKGDEIIMTYSPFASLTDEMVLLNFRSEKVGSTSDMNNTILYSFDYEGNPLSKYVLDRYVDGYCFNDEHIYAISTNEMGEPAIVRYDLKNNLSHAN